jgi:hypothetical protein
MTAKKKLLILLLISFLFFSLEKGFSLSEKDKAESVRKSKDVTSIKNLGKTAEEDVLGLKESGKIIEEKEAQIGSGGGAVSLKNGARVELSAGGIDGPLNLSIVKVENKPLLQQNKITSDVYYLISTTRPRVKGAYTLAIPYDPKKLPKGVAENSLRAYAIYKNIILFPASSEVDTVQKKVIIKNPYVTLLKIPPETILTQKTRPPIYIDPARIGYSIGGEIPFPRLKPCTGAVGDIYEAPNQCFRIIFNARSTPDLAKYISDTLQEAYNLYRREYADAEGRPPFGGLLGTNTISRMQVFLEDFGRPSPLGVYMPWGLGIEYININAPVANNNRSTLRDTLFHEFFHALEDDYCNMTTGSSLAKWWLEAAAEWAGYKYGRNLSFPAAATEYIGRYPHILSVPIEKSGAYEGGELCYGYAPLFDFVQQKRPDYLRYALVRWDMLPIQDFPSAGGPSEALYKSLVAAGNLAQTYPDFVQQMIVPAISADRELWTNVDIDEFKDKTRIRVNKAAEIGASSFSEYSFTNIKERRGVRHLPFAVEPLTTRFLKVKAYRIPGPLTVKLSLTENNNPSDSAWIVTYQPGQAARAQKINPTESVLPGLGSAYRDLWIAVYNSDPFNSKSFDLSIDLVGREEAARTSTGSTTAPGASSAGADLSGKYEWSGTGFTGGLTVREGKSSIQLNSKAKTFTGDFSIKTLELQYAKWRITITGTYSGKYYHGDTPSGNLDGEAKYTVAMEGEIPERWQKFKSFSGTSKAGGYVGTNIVYPPRLATRVDFSIYRPGEPLDPLESLQLFMDLEKK